MRTRSSGILVFAVSCSFVLAGCDILAFDTSTPTTGASTTPTPGATPIHTMSPLPTHSPTPTPSHTTTPSPTPSVSPNTPVATLATEVGLSTSRSIGKAGGTTQSAGNGAVVFVPAAALTTATPVTIHAQDPNTFPSPTQIASHVYDIGPSGTSFAGGVSVSLSVVGTIPSGVRPVLAYLNAQSAWQVVPNSTYNSKTKLVHATVTHFTNFAILLIPSDGSGCAQSPDPNAYCSPSTCSLDTNFCIATSTAAQFYSIGGTLTGLGSYPVTLSITSSQSVTLHANGNFVLPALLGAGAHYTVTVSMQPTNTVCTVAGGTGNVANANVTSVMVTCLPTLALGGVVTGLNAGSQLTLQNANAQITVHGVAVPFALPRLISGSNYNVTVAAQPAGQSCTVANPTGVVGVSNISLAVTCLNLSNSLGGSVTGLVAHTHVTLENGNDAVVASNGNYLFPTAVLGGSNYNVTVISPTGQSCVFGGNVVGVGTMPAGAFNAVNIVCTPLIYSLGGAITGLTGNANVTLTNGNDAISSGNGAYVLPRGVAYAATANVIISNPPGQTCVFNTGKTFYTLTMAALDVNNVNVTCSTNTYSIGGTVSGLVAQAQVTLFNANNTSTAANGKFVLPQRVIYGTDYNISLVSPMGQTCVFLSGQSGTVGVADVTNVNITCSPLTYSLGGTVTGLVNNANVALAFGNQNVSVANGVYTFATPVPYNTRYTVTLVSPASQDCHFLPAGNAVGTMGLGNVNNVNVTCVPHVYTLGGAVTGLVSTASVVLMSGNDTYSTRNGSYHLPTGISYNSNYAVSLAAPANHNCVFTPLDSNAGVMGGVNISNVNVTCTPTPFPLGGSVSGLIANTNVTLTHGREIIAAGNGTYVFPTLVPYGTPYTLSLAAPPGQVCAFLPSSAAFGTMPAAATNANVSCSQTRYNVGGTVSGLTGVLHLLNGNDTITMTTNGSFKMPVPVSYQSNYNVTVGTQPTAQVCVVAQGNGIVGVGDVTTVSVTCAATHTLGGSIVNLAAGGNIIVGNANDTALVAATTPNWTFPTKIGPGGNYNVVVLRQPVGQTCAVIAGVGTMPAQNVSNLAVQCNLTLKFSTNQAAIRVIGQTSFTGKTTAVDSTHLSSPTGAIFAAPTGDLYVGDQLHYRILGYRTGMPTTSGKAFDYVIGQTSFTNLAGWSTPNANNYLPSAMVGNHNYLVQVDGHDNRVLLINGFPRATVNANVVVGQATFVGNANACTQAGLSAPRGASLTSSNKLLVADTANNRVLVWLTLPTANGQSADLVLGQPNFTMCTQPGNNGSGAGTLSQPQDVWSDGTHVLVADTYAYRVLIWNTFPTANGQHADAVLGQADFVSNGSLAGTVGVGGPAGITSDGNSIFVAEYGYSRATQWSGVPWNGVTPTLTAVLGEVDQMTTTCNQGSATPSANSLCQAAGITIVGTQLVVTDMSNNRLMVYQSQ